MRNPFLNRIAKRADGSHGQASEKRVSKSVGGKLRPGSGALPGAKGDFSHGLWLVESKATINASMKLDYAWLLKISTEALNIGRSPALTVSFTMPDGKARQSGDWILVPMRVWQAMVENTSK